MPDHTLFMIVLWKMKSTKSSSEHRVGSEETEGIAV